MSQESHEGRYVRPGMFTHGKGKRLSRTARGAARVRFLLRVVGVALWVACPYLYYTTMLACEGHVLELACLIALPLVVDLIALFIHMKGKGVL